MNNHLDSQTAFLDCQLKVVIEQVTERLNEKLVRERGPLVAFCLEDPRTEDILLNPDGRVWVERITISRLWR
jgi:Flp pilus assembly CpaF family ATPase